MSTDALTDVIDSLLSSEGKRNALIQAIDKGIVTDRERIKVVIDHYKSMKSPDFAAAARLEETIGEDNDALVHYESSSKLSDAMRVARKLGQLGVVERLQRLYLSKLETGANYAEAGKLAEELKLYGRAQDQYIKGELLADAERVIIKDKGEIEGAQVIKEMYSQLMEKALEAKNFSRALNAAAKLGRTCEVKLAQAENYWNEDKFEAAAEAYSAGGKSNEAKSMWLKDAQQKEGRGFFYLAAESSEKAGEQAHALVLLAREIEYQEKRGNWRNAAQAARGMKREDLAIMYDKLEKLLPSAEVPN